MKMPTRLLALAAGLALATSVAHAQEAKPASSKSTDGLSDRKVVRDPVTGVLRPPTPEEEAELRAAAPPLAPNVLTIRRPNASVERRADGSATGKRTFAQMQNLVLDTSDGKMTIRHGDTPVTPRAPSAPTE